MYRLRFISNACVILAALAFNPYIGNIWIRIISDSVKKLEENERNVAQLKILIEHIFTTDIVNTEVEIYTS